MDQHAEPVEVVKQSFLHMILSGGGMTGWVILGFGFVLTLWAFLNFVRRAGHRAVAAQLLFTAVPLILGHFGLIAAINKFADMAASPVAPKPVEFAQIVSTGFSWGVLATGSAILPLFLGSAALLRRPRRPRETDTIE